MNIETDVDSVSKSSNVSCITIEDDSDEIEIIELDDEIEEDVQETYSFQENDVIDTSNDVEDSNLCPPDDPLVKGANKNNTEYIDDDVDDENNADNDDGEEQRTRLSLCSHNCYLKVSEEDKVNAFHAFRGKNTQLSKFQFMDELIESEVKVKTNRNYSRFFLNKRPQRKNVCRLCFLCCLQISNNFLRAYFKYRSNEHLPLENFRTKNSSTDKDGWKNGNPTINIIEENNDNRDTVFRNKLPRLGWMRIPSCEKMCSLRVQREDQKQIFISYWFKSAREDRYKFICDMTDIVYKDSKLSFSFYLYTLSGLVNVCKSCFCTVLNETPTFFYQALKIKCFKLSHTLKIMKHNALQDVIDLEIETQKTGLKADKQLDDNKKDLNCESDLGNSEKDSRSNLEPENKKKEDEIEKNCEIAFDNDNYEDIFEVLKNPKYESVENYLNAKYEAKVSYRGCGCHLKITKDDNESLFYSFWNHTINSRFNFIMELIELPKYSCKLKRRIFSSAKYYFFRRSVRLQKVCKFCFLSILDISRMFLDSVLEEQFRRQKDDSAPLSSIKATIEESDVDNKLEEVDLESAEENEKNVHMKLSQGWISLQPCKFNCAVKVTKKEQERIFKAYWTNSTVQSRHEFITNMVDIVQKQKSTWRIFHLHTSKGRIRVCRTCFRATLNESVSFLFDSVQKKVELDSNRISFNIKYPETGKLENLQISDLNFETHSSLEVNDFDDIYDSSKKNPEHYSDHYYELLEQWTPLRPCTRTCHLLITKRRQKQIFDSYWRNATEKTRSKFILEMTEVKPTLSFLSNEFKNTHRRYMTIFYLSSNTSMRLQKVCKECFRFVLLEKTLFIKKVLDDIFFSMTEMMINPGTENFSWVSHYLESINKDKDDLLALPSSDTMKDEDIEKKACNCPKNSESEKCWSPLPACINDCHLKITEVEQRNIFLSYWQEQLFNSRFNFINRRTELTLQETCDKADRKEFRRGYYFVTSKGRQKFCKYCFNHVLDVSETFVSSVFNQKLYNMLRLNIISIKPNMIFVYCEDESLKPRTLESIKSENEICENCEVRRRMKIKDGVPHLTPCFNLCQVKVTKSDKNRIFYDYWQGKTIEIREKFICDMIKNSSILFTKEKDGMEFCLHTENGIVSICKSCFSKIINESFDFISNALSKKSKKFGIELKLKNSIQEKRIKENNESVVESTSNEIEKEVASFSTVNTVIKNDVDVENDLKNNMHQEVIEETSSNDLSSMKTECEDETPLPDGNEGHETDSLENETNEKLNEETNSSNDTSLLKTKCIEEINVPGSSNEEHETDNLKNKTNEKLNEDTNSSSDTSLIKTECIEEIIVPDSSDEEHKTDNSKSETNKKLNEETNSSNDTSLIKTECEEAINVADEDVKIITDELPNNANQELIEETNSLNDSSLLEAASIEKNNISDKNEELENSKSSNNTNEANVKETDSLGLVSVKIECVEENIVPDKDVELKNNDSQEKINKTHSLSELCVIKTEREEENILPDNDEIETYDLKNNSNEVNVGEKNSLNDSRVLTVKCEEEIITSDKNEELENISENNSNQENRETNSLNNVIIKQECEEETPEMDGNSMSALNPVTESIILPLKRKSSEMSKETDESFPGLSIIKEELDLENEVSLEIEKYDGPPQKITKTSPTLELNYKNSDIPIVLHEEKIELKEELKIQIPIIKQEPITEETNKNVKTNKNKESNKNEEKASNKNVDMDEIVRNEIRKLRMPKLTRKRTVYLDPVLGKETKTPKRNNPKLKSRSELFIEQQMEKILKKYGGNTITENNLLDNKIKKVTKSSSCELQNPSAKDQKLVEEHIRKFPLCESYHFNCKSSEKYLPMGLTAKIMYDLYKMEIARPVTNIWYNKILEKADLKFRTSFLMKCNVCSAAAVQYKLAKDLSEKSKINSHRTAHLIDSEEANNAKSLDEKNSRTEKSLLVCTFGFQQSFPTPYLNDPLSYYKERLWTYNFTIRNFTNKRVDTVCKFYMWNENDGKRSANEMASCLYSYLKNLPPKTSNVIFYSTCDEESKSKNLSAMFSYLIANHETLESVEHKFLVYGHSQIEVKCGFQSVQEIMNDYQGTIHQPNDWYDVFKRFTQRSEVEIKDENGFYDFDSVRDKIFGINDQSIDEDVKCLRYTKQGIFYKTKWGATNRYQPMNLDCSLKDLNTMKLQNLKKVPVTEEKKKDLLDLFPFLKPNAQDFYQKLFNEKLVENQDVCDSNSKIDETSEVEKNCKEIVTGDIINSPNESPIIERKSKRKCKEIQNESEDTDDICIIENDVSDVLQKVCVNKKKRNTKSHSKKSQGNNEFELVLIKEEEFEQS